MKQIPKKVQFQDLGRIDYDKAWSYQTELHEQLKDRKIKARKQGSDYKKSHYLLFAEHNHVYTLGKSGKESHLLLSDEELVANDIDYYKINRGGDITYHGLGQITAYPIFDLDDFFTDVHTYVRKLEEVVIACLKLYNINGIRKSNFTGVWIKDGIVERKICALGVHLSRWVTMHGIALNVSTDLSYFNNIVPCGIEEENTAVTSISEILGSEVDYEEAKIRLKKCFQQIFDLEYIKKADS